MIHAFCVSIIVFAVISGILASALCLMCCFACIASRSAAELRLAAYGIFACVLYVSIMAGVLDLVTIKPGSPLCPACSEKEIQSD